MTLYEDVKCREPDRLMVDLELLDLDGTFVAWFADT
jgi:hypothetical protein